MTRKVIRVSRKVEQTTEASHHILTIRLGVDETTSK